MSRRWLSTLGVAAFAIGVALAILPEAGAVGLNRLLLTFEGAVMVVLAAVAVRRWRTPFEPTETTEPEAAMVLSSPGDDVQATVDGLAGQALVADMQQLRERLHEVAVAVIAQTRRLSEAEATAVVEEGRWTDDATVATYLTDGFAAFGFGREVLQELVGGAMKRLPVERVGPRRALVVRVVDAIGGVLDMAPLSSRQRSIADRPRTAIDEDDRTAPESGTRTVRATRETGHWSGVGAIALAFAGVGIAAGNTAVTLVAVVGVVFAAYARLPARSAPELSLDRELDASEPVRPGEEITVRVTVTNAGSRPLPDVRLVDGVPEALRVTEGGARIATALRTGESATLRYRVEAARGRHRFQPALVIDRSLTGAHEHELLLHEPTAFACVPRTAATPAPVPLRERAAQFVGNVAAMKGGGTEFHSVRAYRHGDPLSRIDWNRHARTGEIATIEFREERAAKVLILLDGRAEAYYSHGPSADADRYESVDAEPNHTMERAVRAAGQLFEALLADGNRVGIAAFGPRDCWVAPGMGQEHTKRATDRLALDEAFSPYPPPQSTQLMGWFRRLYQRLAEDTQVVYVSPLCDDYSTTLARQLDARRLPVTVLSPDPTSDETVGRRIAYIERRLRATELRRADIPVVDWGWDQTLGAALRRADGRRP